MEIINQVCPVAHKCGGCKYQNNNYELQLEEKQKLVEKHLKKYCKVEPIIGMNDPYHYRNKVHAVFDTDKRGNIISGVYEYGSHKVVSVKGCLIEDQRADTIISTIRNMLKSFKLRTYCEDTKEGLFRHVLIRSGYKTGQIMVVLILASPIFPSKNNFIKVLLEKHPEITTIILNVNNKKTSMILGEKEIVLYGKRFIEDRLCDKIFQISPKSFYQVNPVQTEILYNKAVELADFKGDENVVDAYCGIGTIGLILSSHVKNVIGVELNADAVRDAITNSKRNNIQNIRFYKDDAGEFLSRLAEGKQSIDIVFTDPPRIGCDNRFLYSVASLKPEKVIYISCNPETLARDLKFLTQKGYKAMKVIPVDMFPFTEHVETLVLMSKMRDCESDGNTRF